MKMKRNRILSAIMAAALSLSLLAGCNGNSSPSSSAEPSSEPSSQQSASAPSSTPESEPESKVTLSEPMNIAVLKGPTGLGAVKLIADADESYAFTVAAAPDEVTSKLLNGELDLAAVPSNLAATLYNKTEGKISVLAVNTLGVLYVLQKGVEIHSLADLAGQTVITSGQGTTAQYTVEYLLQQAGVDPATGLTLEYHTEHADAAAAFMSAETAIAILPQPFVTTVTMKDANASIALNLTEVWAETTEVEMPQGVLVARNEYLEANKEAVDAFLSDYKASIEYVNANPADAAAMAEGADIMAANIAEKAIPNCNIVYLDGDGMQTAVTAFLQIMFDYNPKSVGGSLPNEDFYYKK
jgi:NitT/TauT family transport system substrate-binding protein